MRPSALVVVQLALLATPRAHANERLALLFTSDVGLPGETSLRYTGADADRLASVLTDVGGFRQAEVRVQKSASADQVASALKALGERASKLETLLVYYSGHADAEALHPEGSLLPLPELLRLVRAVPAKLRMTIIDACQSGAATRAKGVRAGPAFDVRFDAADAEGQVVITSSAIDELSFESDSQRGALFTMNWTSGLRGAADRDSDGRVTLSEAYAYAYTQTLRSTLLSSAGPQHPTFRWELEGQRDPILSQLNTGAQLTFVAEEGGRYIVFDAEERAVIAELAVSQGERRRLALAPTRYVVKKRGSKDVRWASVALTDGDERLLYDHQMRAVPLAVLARKGIWSNISVAVSMGQLATTLGADGFWLLRAGAEWEYERWLLGGEVALSAGSVTHGSVQGEYSSLITTDMLLVGPQVFAVYVWRIGLLNVRVGPAMGLYVVSQRTQAQPDLIGSVPFAGARLRLELPLGTRVSVIASGDAAMAIARARGEGGPFQWDVGGGLKVAPLGEYGVGVRVVW